jgi:hypothetical protein
MIPMTALASLKDEANEHNIVRIGCRLEGTPSAIVRKATFSRKEETEFKRRIIRSTVWQLAAVYGSSCWLFLRRTTAEPSPNGTDDGDASPVRITASQHFGQGARKAAVSRPSTIQAGRRRVSRGDAPSEVRM